MSEARILDAIRRGLGRGALPEGHEGETRLTSPETGPIPARARGAAPDLVERFVEMAEEAAATVARVARPEEVPAAVAHYLARHNLPAALRLAPDEALLALPWGDTALAVSAGPARPSDAVSLTPAVAGVAETGTLVLVSGPLTPTTLNFLPDDHIVLLGTSQVVGAYEDALALVRRRGAMPRTVNFITGPSRSADIEQQLQMGAHGPRRLHILLVDDRAA